MAEMRGWTGRVALVTGAAMGIGEGTAGVFAEAGAHVVLADVDGKALRVAVTKIEAAGGRAIGVEADVSAEADVGRLVERIRSRFGRLDALVNNAGIMRRHASLAEWPADEFRRIIDVNLTALFLVTKAAAPLMAAGDGGAVVNIASLGGIISVPYSPPYAAAKAGVLGLTRSFVPLLESSGIRVNAILPSLVDTPLTRDAPGRGQMAMLAPRDVGRAVLHVASDPSMNGRFIRVDKTDAGPRISFVQDPPSTIEIAMQPY